MIIQNANEKYDTRFNTMLCFSDWRFSAAALGLIKYFKNYGIDYSTKLNDREDLLLYNREDILISENEDRYYSFVEKEFKDKIYNSKIFEYLDRESLSEDEKKELNSLLKQNSILSKVFKGQKYSKENIDNLKRILSDNRIQIIRETYRNGKATYSNFCNKNSLEKESVGICRVIGYYVDIGKKRKSLGFNWDYNKFVSEDFPEFDYIPFAFTKTRESFFINNNSSAENLYNANRILYNKIKNDVKDNKENSNPRKALFLAESLSSEFLDYQVEVILKDREKDYFETIFVRDKAIDIFKEISKMKDDNVIKAITNPCKYGNSSYLNMTNIVVDSILNNIKLDFILDKLLKDRNNHGYLISQLIRINEILYLGVENMDKNIMFAKSTAEKVVNKFIEDNKQKKITSYRNKLISSLSFKDYDRFKTILLQLSSYSGVTFDFAYNLFDDFEKNKNIAYAFVNALTENKSNENNNRNDEGKKIGGENEK